MATKDKLINLEDLKVLSDHVEGEVTDLKSDLVLKAGKPADSGTDISNGESDLNNFPVGSVYYIRTPANFTHLPTNKSGTILTVSYAISDSPVGKFQMYVTTDGSNTIEYIRNYSHANTAWFAWKRLLNENDYSTLTALIPSVPVQSGYLINSTTTYPSFDDFPVGSVYCVNVTTFNNMPVQSRGTLITSSYADDGTWGSFQVYFTSNRVYFRTRYNPNNIWSNWKSVQNLDDVDPIDHDYTAFSMFEKFAVIGDSFASGEVYLSDGQGGYNAHDYYNVSWGQNLARRNGNTCINMSAGGLRTDTWLTSSTRGLGLLNSSDPQDLYIIVLGLNDAAYKGLEYLGTSSDFNLSDYGNTPDTFYGNMCKIIGNILNKSPNAKIILSTMASNTSEVNVAFNEAIVNCATLAGVGLIEQYNDVFFKSSYYQNNMVQQHPTAPLYSGMSKAIERLICDCIKNNVSYFQDYVGT